MTNKIAILLAVIISTTIIISVAYAELKPTQDRFSNMCENKLLDGKMTVHDYICAVNIYQMYYDIIDTQNKLDILHGKISAEPLPLTLNITPDSIIQGEKFRVYGTANVYELDGVGFHIFNPNGTLIQHEDSDLELDNHYASLPITPNNKWIMEGNYTIEAYHNDENVTKTIQYTLGQNP